MHASKVVTLNFASLMNRTKGSISLPKCIRYKTKENLVSLYCVCTFSAVLSAYKLLRLNILFYKMQIYKL